jgi:hypothetical protein
MASTEWKTVSIAPTPLPEGVLEGLEAVAEFGNTVEQTFPLIDAAITAGEAAAVALVNPAMAALEAALQGVEDVLTGFSALSVKFIVVTDPPQIGRAASSLGTLDSRWANFSSATSRVKLETADFKQSVLNANNVFKSNAELPANIVQRANALQNNINALFNTASVPLPQTLGVQLAESVRDSGDPNRPGAEGQTQGAAMVVTAYGDAAALQAVWDVVLFLRALFVPAPAETVPPASKSLSYPEAVSAVNAGTKSSLRPRVRWTNPTNITLQAEVNDATYTLAAVTVERAQDATEASWRMLLTRTAVYQDLKLKSPLGTAYEEQSALTTTSAAYRISYVYTAPGQPNIVNSVVTRTNKLKVIAPGNGGAPPDWSSATLKLLPEFSTAQLQEFRQSIRRAQDIANQGLKQGLAATRAWIAKIRAGIVALNAAIARLRALLSGNLVNGVASVKLFQLTNVTEYSRAFDNINNNKADTTSAIRTLASVRTTTPFMQTLAGEFERAFTELPRAQSTAGAGIAAAFVFDTPAATGVFNVFSSLLGLADTAIPAFNNLVQQLQSGYADGKALWVPADPLPQTDAADITQSTGEGGLYAGLDDALAVGPVSTIETDVGEANYDLNIAPADGTYPTPRVGETDTTGTDLNCPPE